MSEIEEARITELGNPAKPQGNAGVIMLNRMNQSHAEVTAWGLELLAAEPADDVLDIGCGGGAALGRLAESVTQGTLTGVDYSGVSVQTAITNNRAAVDAGRMKIVEGSVEALPFPDNAFDRILTVESFYFWPNPAENLKEVLRVLRPGGRFALIADIYGRDDLPESAKQNVKQFHMFNPDPDTFRVLFAQAGFSETVLHFREGTTWICVCGEKEETR